MASKLNHYVGAYADDAGANAAISATWGAKDEGIFYRNTTTGKLRFWDDTAWTELAAPSLTQWGEDRIIYFGKHGNDANVGDAINIAKLTISAAITAAAALVPAPSLSNPAAVVCLDGGVYAENVTTQSYINVYAPNATINGILTLVDEVAVTVDRIDGVAPICVVKNAGSGTAKLDCGRLDIPASATGIFNLGTNAVMIAEVKQVWINGNNSFGIGDLSATFGHVHVEIEDIYLTADNGVAISRGGTGSTVGNVTHIINLNDGGGNIGISQSGGEIDLSVEKISADTAYTVQAGAELNLRVNKLQGSTVVAAGADARVLNTRATPLTGTGNPDGSVQGFNGQIYTDTTNNVMYVCESQPTGTAWRVI